MELNINDYRVLIGAVQSLNIKGSDAIYMASLLNKLQDQVSRLEIESQEGKDFDSPKSETTPESKPKPKK
jgi:hypothetical protein